MIELVDFLIKYMNVIIPILLFICGIVLGYMSGRFNSITDDIKSLDYDRLEYKYHELKRSIETIERERNPFDEHRKYTKRLK